MSPHRIALIGIGAFLLAAATAVVALWLLLSLPRTSVPVLPVRASGAILWMADAGLLTEAEQQFLNEEQQRALDTLLQTAGRAALGPDVSVRYDVLPALGETLIVWDDETRSWTLYSTVQNAEQFLDRLHASFRAGMPTVRRTQQLLDDRFPLDMVQVDAETVTDESTQENGWTVRVMRPISGSGSLTSARRGGEIVLGQNPAAVRALMTETITPPAPWRGILAIGSLPRPLLQSETAELFLPASLRERASGADAPILWSLRRQDDTLTFILH